MDRSQKEELVASLHQTFAETNLIIVTATTTSWSAGYGGNTTFNAALRVLRLFNRLVIDSQPSDQFARPGTNVTFTVTEGAATSYVTVLSAETEAALTLPAASFASPPATEMVTVPLPVAPPTATL